MERSNIKFVVIILLLVLNSFLVLNLVMNSAYSESVGEDELRDLSAALSRFEVRLLQGALPAKVIRSGKLEVRRNEEMERQIAESFLGSSAAEELGGGLVQYTSSQGSAIFRQNFEFEIELSNSDFDGKSDENVRRELEALLDRAGFGLEETDARREGEAFVLTASQYIGGLKVRNLSVRAAIYRDGGLSLRGRWIFSYGRSEDESLSMAAASLTIPFADAVKKRGYGLTRINDISYCYYFSQSSGGGFELLPACGFETDAGFFCVDSRRFALLDEPGIEGI